MQKFLVPRSNVTFFFKVKYIWTSGRLCDFKGCNRPDLLPNEINGWFWTAELQKLAPTTNRQQNDWSEGGGIGKPQPDNRVNNNNNNRGQRITHGYLTPNEYKK